MGKTKLLIGLAVAVIIAGGAWFIIGSSSQTPSPEIGNTPVSTTTPEQPAPQNPITPSPIPPVKKPPVVVPPAPVKPPGPAAFTMVQIASHNSSASCYTTINGSVYDLTSWIDQHPGGRENILSICGKDGTAAFTNQHGGQSQPQQILATFKIGVLAP